MAKRTDHPVEAAHARLDRAVEVEAEEERRHVAALELVARLAQEIRSMDPDADAEAFAKLVAARDAARGRAEALGERLERATAAVKALAAAVEEAKREASAARAAEIDRELRELDDQVRAEAAAFLDEIHAKIARARRKAQEANLLEHQLGQKGAHATRARGSVLACMAAGPAALRHVASMLPAPAVGADPIANLVEIE